MRRPTHSTDVDGPPDRKAVLFCPVCGHESPVDGDWVVRERTTGIEYRCPECDERLTERRRERSPLARAWSAWVRAANTWFRPPRRLRV